MTLGNYLRKAFLINEKIKKRLITLRNVNPPSTCYMVAHSAHAHTLDHFCNVLRTFYGAACIKIIHTYVELNGEADGDPSSECFRRRHLPCSALPRYTVKKKNCRGVDPLLKGGKFLQCLLVEHCHMIFRISFRGAKQLRLVPVAWEVTTFRRITGHTRKEDH